MQGEELVVQSSKCEDCGNQAKKGCAYSRCRTCCKNKGFQCQTHVRSTWIPVDRRRQRPLDHHHQQQPSPTNTTNPHHLQGDDHDIPKRHKHNPYSEELEFPAAMSSVAIFNCVRVRSMDDTVNEIAYQTSVNIGGHVFSGLLYDQGPELRPRGESSTHTLVHQQQHNLNLMMMSDAIHTRDDGATMPSLPATTTAILEPFFPLPSFRPGMPYFQQHPKP